MFGRPRSLDRGVKVRFPTMSRCELLGVGRDAVSKVVGRAVWTGGAIQFSKPP